MKANSTKRMFSISILGIKMIIITSAIQNLFSCPIVYCSKRETWIVFRSLGLPVLLLLELV